jgi:hypothetical protein
MKIMRLRNTLRRNSAPRERFFACGGVYACWVCICEFVSSFPGNSLRSSFCRPATGHELGRMGCARLHGGRRFVYNYRIRGSADGSTVRANRDHYRGFHNGWAVGPRAFAWARKGRRGLGCMEETIGPTATFCE